MRERKEGSKRISIICLSNYDDNIRAGVLEAALLGVNGESEGEEEDQFFMILGVREINYDFLGILAEVF